MRAVLLSLTVASSSALSVVGAGCVTTRPVVWPRRAVPPLLQNAQPQGRKSLRRETLEIAAPALLGLAIDPIASLADTGFISRCCGAASLAGAGLAISVFNLVSKTFNFLSSATTSAVASASCEDDEMCVTAGVFSPQMASQAAASLALAAAVGCALVLLLSLSAGPLLRQLGVTAASPLAAPARAYLVVRALGAPAVLMLMTLQGAFRGARDTTTPLAALVALTIVNIALDPILIARRGLDWGVAGAAAATVIAQCVGTAVLWRALATSCKDACAISENGTLLGLPRPSMRHIVAFARSGGILTLRTLSGVGALSFSSVVCAGLGEAIGAAHQITFQVWLTGALLADAIAVAAQALLATSLAARDTARARAIVRSALAQGVVAGAAIGGMLSLGGGTIRRLFSAEASVLAAAEAVWPLVVATQPLSTLAFAVDGLLFGAKDFGFCAVLMVAASVPAIGIMRAALVRPPLAALSQVWIGLGTLMLLRSVLGIARIYSRTGPWAELEPGGPQTGTGEVNT